MLANAIAENYLTPLIPAQAGIQKSGYGFSSLDPRLRRDERGVGRPRMNG